MEFQLQQQSFQWILRTPFLWDWLVWSPRSPWNYQSSSSTPQFKISILQRSGFFIVQLSHPYMTSGKTIALIRQTFVSKVMSLLFNMLSRMVITFLPRRKHLLISWLQLPSAVILESPQNKVSQCFHCFHFYLPWSDGTGCHDLSFLNVSFKPTFPLSSCTFIKRLFSSSSFPAIRVGHLVFEVIDILPDIFIPACASSRLAFHMMHFACKLNKQGDNI